MEVKSITKHNRDNSNPDGSLTEKEVIPDPNATMMDISYVTSLDSIAIENVGSGYADNDTLTVDGGLVVELNIQDGFIVVEML